MKYIIICFALLLSQPVLYAQQFISTGKIEFERKVNIHKLYMNEAEGDNSWIEYIKKTAPQFITSYFDLTFKGDHSIYKPGREVFDPKAANWSNFPGNANTVYSDFAKGEFLGSKQVFETLYLIQDSIPKMDWKITSEMRKIAGFNCRRAETIIMDSVYIVAFYTDEILATGGPESFNGLPGMILGIAIPRMHVTLFATKLEVTEVKDTDIKAPTKGKKTNGAAMRSTLQAATKNWGKESARNIWFLTI